jgi:hypothetical protein
MRDLVASSGSVYLAYETENTQSKQTKTDAGHDRQREIIKDLTGRYVNAWQNPNVKDLAELNAQQIKEESNRSYFDDQDYGPSR